MNPRPAAPLLPVSAAARFYDGRLARVRLNHPEGVAVDARDGALWCGGEHGELYRIGADGRSCEQRAGTGGYALGLCQARDGRLFLCDWARESVMIFDGDGRPSGELKGRDGDERLRLPNFPLLSRDERFLYVSDTRADGPGIWRFDLEDGRAELWMREACRGANGLALSPGGTEIFLVESRRPGVSRVPILPDGSAGRKEPFISFSGDEPDGLAFDDAGRLYIAIWHPSRIYRWSDAAGLELVIEDAAQDVLHHPTNIAFRGAGELFAANLGGWHLTRIDLSALST
ncbi:SMP-30/gluconolactonase/LRE family protein [Termitidicoccus mucosus]|uniref:SMP-30/Gluconolactonase/LRE-like region domain-containing protein n=1 Tax=Termitidicoccus mucosus TaxID=1184151 RepID=A0A178IEP3_9BACT|nr:hypothetical protein AW736_18680 [Opitutaceae bacterium TSB47]